MKNNSKLVLALLIAGATSTVFPGANAYAADEVKNIEIQSEYSSDEIDAIIGDLQTTYVEIVQQNYQDANDKKPAIPADDEVTFPKNEQNTRKSDGTNKFNRATETDRETFGEDKNVTNIDPEVAKKLEETNGEYGKKDGAYANNNLKAITSPIKNIVVNPGKNENEVAITWFAKGDVNENSKLVFDGVEYKTIRARKTGDSNDYSTYTALVTITPGKSYKYYVQTGEYKSEEYTLTTKGLGENNEFKIAYLGDPQIGSGDKVWDSKGLYKNTQAKVDQDKIDFEKTINKAREFDPHFYLSMGDNVEIVSYEGEYDYFLDNDLFKERIFSTVMGNHETYVDQKDTSQQNTVFSDHFYLPNESELGSSSKVNEDGSKTYIPGDYYYSYGDTLFLNINSNEIDSAKHQIFIEEAIAKATKDHGKNFSWKVVSFHHAPYSTATHTSDDDILQRRSELVKVFNENGIDIVLNGHDHIYARTPHMVSGELALDFKDAYGTDPDNKNAGIEDGFSKTYNNKVYKNGKVIVDGIPLNYSNKSVTNPRGTMFVTMSASAGAKFYNPIGEDQWFVNRSLDDRSQLFSNLTFSKNSFNIQTMDPTGTIVDNYSIYKTDEYIANPNMYAKSVNYTNLDSAIKFAESRDIDRAKENIDMYNDAIAKAKAVLNYKNSNQEEVDAAIEVLNTRLSEVKFLEENKIIEETTAAKAEVEERVAKNEAPKKDVAIGVTDNPKTGIGSLTGVIATLGLAVGGLFKSKRK